MSAPQWVPRDRARRAVLRALEAELADARRLAGAEWVTPGSPSALYGAEAVRVLQAALTAARRAALDAEGGQDGGQSVDTVEVVAAEDGVPWRSYVVPRRDDDYGQGAVQ